MNCKNNDCIVVEKERTYKRGDCFVFEENLYFIVVINNNTVVLHDLNKFSCFYNGIHIVKDLNAITLKELGLEDYGHEAYIGKLTVEREK